MVCHRNHPIIKEDGVLASFLTEPHFEEWRKHTSITYEEESASKRVDRVEEMSIPSDLDDKLAYVLFRPSAISSALQYPHRRRRGILHFDCLRITPHISGHKFSVRIRVRLFARNRRLVCLPRLTALFSVVRGKISFLIEHWQRICLLTERIVRRREAAAVRLTPVLRPSFLPTHLPSFSLAASLSTSALVPSGSTRWSSHSAPASPSRTSAASSADASDRDSASSIFSGLTGAARRTTTLDGQADLSRLTNTFKALVEVNERCWRGEDCELCAGVRQGLGHVSDHTQRHADALEHRVCVALITLCSYSWPITHASPGRCCIPRWKH